MRKSVLAPAKINLYLEVCGRRPDGYHELGMVMQRVDLCDRLDISVGGAPGVRVVCPGLELAAEDENIAARAARAMVELSGRQVGIDICIEKHIPVAAGLGGGSSDAASVLLALNEMLALHLGRDELARVGVALGADVPFFLFDGTAWAAGIGERLERFCVGPNPYYVLVNPGEPVSTAWVYQSLGLTGLGPAAKMPGFPKTRAALLQMLRNDLEPVTSARYPQVEAMKSGLLSLGAEGAMMSGSGPTVFGIFFDRKKACRAAQVLAEKPGWRAFVTRPI